MTRYAKTLSLVFALALALVVAACGDMTHGPVAPSLEPGSAAFAKKAPPPSTEEPEDTTASGYGLAWP